MSEAVLKQYASKKGVTVYGIHKKTGVPINTIDNAFKKSVSQSSVRVIKAFADTLDVEAGALLDELLKLDEKAEINMTKTNNKFNLEKVEYVYSITLNESYEKNGSKLTSKELVLSNEQLNDNALFSDVKTFFENNLNLDELEDDIAFFDLDDDVKQLVNYINESKESREHSTPVYNESYFVAELREINVDLTEYLTHDAVYKLEMIEAYKYKNADDYRYTDDVECVELTADNAKITLNKQEKGYVTYMFLHDEANDIVSSEVILNKK